GHGYGYGYDNCCQPQPTCCDHGYGHQYHHGYGHQYHDPCCEPKKECFLKRLFSGCGKKNDCCDYGHDCGCHAPVAPQPCCQPQPTTCCEPHDCCQPKKKCFLSGLFGGGGGGCCLSRGHDDCGCGHDCHCGHGGYDCGCHGQMHYGHDHGCCEPVDCCQPKKKCFLFGLFDGGKGCCLFGGGHDECCDSGYGYGHAYSQDCGCGYPAPITAPVHGHVHGPVHGPAPIHAPPAP
ncbi:MAG: hypothetical protein ACREJB_16715, partial [Planctomycetaceae bacterium]